MAATQSLAPQQPLVTHPSCTVLFLCTGNYYRSRFAEELFNHLAAERGLSQRATSLGFTPHPEINPGSMSKFALVGLEKRKVQPLAASRMPLAVAAADFERFACCIALCEREHRPMMERKFPAHLSKIRFWNIEDLAFPPPEHALAAIHNRVQALVEEFAAQRAD